MADIRRVVKALVAGPRDTSEVRELVKTSIHSWNDQRSARTGFIIHPLSWEMAVPQVGAGDAQSLINAQLVDESDIVIAVFREVFGSPTRRAASGTAEEIERAVAAGRFVHVYFSRAQLSRDFDIAELSRVRRFETRMQRLGLVGHFETFEELALRVHAAIDLDVEKLRAA